MIEKRTKQTPAENQQVEQWDLNELAEQCPTCGIARYYLECAHSTALPHVDVCPDEFHGDEEHRRARAEHARDREAKEQRDHERFEEWLTDPDNAARWKAALTAHKGDRDA